MEGQRGQSCASLIFSWYTVTCACSHSVWRSCLEDSTETKAAIGCFKVNMRWKPNLFFVLINSLASDNEFGAIKCRWTWAIPVNWTDGMLLFTWAGKRKSLNQIMCRQNKSFLKAQWIIITFFICFSGAGYSGCYDSETVIWGLVQVWSRGCGYLKPTAWRWDVWVMSKQFMWLT